jgi:TrpR-related protein YerC/YecD
MSQISKYPIRKEVVDRIFEILFKTLSHTRNNKESYYLAEDLFTPTEKIMLSKRLAIAFLLMKGYQYRSISNLLKVSLGTIASVNTYLNYGKGGYRIVLDRITKEEQLDEFFSGMLEKLVSIPAASTKGGGVWRDLRNEVRKQNKTKHKEF